MTENLEKTQPKTFAELVNALAALDDEIAAESFDPAQIVGDLRDKVDALQNVISRMEHVGDWLRATAKPILERARQIESNRQNLRTYVAESMKNQNLEKVPGHAYYVRLRESPVSLVLEREPKAEDIVIWPHYVTLEQQMTWNKTAIKEDLLAGMLHGFPAKIVCGVWPEFRLNVPEKLERKKK